MSVIEKLSTISQTINKLFDFVSTDEEIKSDLNEYLSTIGANNQSPSQLQATMLPYVFERRIGKDRKSIIEIFLEKNKKINSVQKSIIENLSNSVSSVFEIKKVLRNGFEVYSMVNEKDYTVTSLVKMSNFRGVCKGQFIIGRIFPFEDEYFMLEIAEILPANEREKALRVVVSRQVKEPEKIYQDNNKKLKELETLISDLDKKFVECFDKNEIITLNSNADDLISIFNDFAEENIAPDKKEIDKKISLPSEYRYFEVMDVESGNYDLLERASEGFASHQQSYDVGMVFNKELGLFILPFYGTFCKIFETKDYKGIRGYKECIKNFLENEKYPHFVLINAAEKYPNFLKIINEVLEENYTLEELLHKYKADYLESKIFSSTSVLYSSKVFGELMGFVGGKEKAQTTDFANVGRNDSCPCGSGKKYKKCCIK